MTVIELITSIRKYWLLILVAAILGTVLSLSIWGLSPVTHIVQLFTRVSHSSLLSGDQLMDIKLRYGVSIDFLDENTMRLGAISTSVEGATANVERVVDYLDGLATLHDNARSAVAQDLLDGMGMALSQLSTVTTGAPPAQLGLLQDQLALLRRELSADRFIVPGTQSIEVQPAPRSPAKPVLSGLAYGIFAGIVISALLSLRDRRAGL